MERILFKLLLLHGNEASTIDDMEAIEGFNKLIIEVTKSIYNIRYCPTKYCSCHPEYSIKEILRNKVLVCFLDDNAKGLVAELKRLCEDYVPVVADGIYEDS